MKNGKVAVEVLIAGAEIGRAVTVEVPLHRPKFAKTIGSVKLELRA